MQLMKPILLALALLACTSLAPAQENKSINSAEAAVLNAELNWETALTKADVGALQNLYEMMPQDENISKSLEQEYNEYLSRPTTEEDTHPSPKDRFKLIAQIKCREIAPIDGQVWDLFKDKNALTIEMNDLLEARLKAMM